MSAGAFQLSKYESDGATVYPVRIQPETLALVINGVTNTAPAGAIDGEGSVRVSAGRRSFGVIPRKVTVKFGDNPPAGYLPRGRVSLPWLKSDGFTNISRGQTGTYLGVAIEVVSRTSEQVR